MSWLGLLDGFLGRAALAALGTALAAAPLGCFVVWRRLAYFGDATSHAALLGVALALALEVSISAGIFAMALMMAGLVTLLSGRALGSDTALGVLSHSALAFGLVAVSFLPGVRVDLMGYLFGDVLAVSRADLAVIWGGGAAVTALLAWRWSKLLTVTVSPELAVSAGIDPRWERLALTLALAVVVAVAIRTVGAVLIASLLIIPAAAARPFAGTPERMVAVAALVGAAAALGGLALAWHADTPAGPSIVATAATLFAVSTVVAALRG